MYYLSFMIMDKSFKPKKLTELPSWYEDIEKRYISITKRKNDIDKELADIRTELMSHMKDDKIKKIVTELTSVHMISSRHGVKIDQKRLEKDHPDIYADYSVPYKISEHVQVSFNNNHKLND